MNKDHAIGNNIPSDKIYLARVELVKQGGSLADPLGGRYYFPDLPQLNGKKIVGFEIQDGRTELPTLVPPDTANLGTWSGFFNTGYLTFYSMEGDQLMKDAPIVAFWLRSLLNPQFKKIAPINAVIDWRKSYLDLYGFAAAVPVRIFLNISVYYNSK